MREFVNSVRLDLVKRHTRREREGIDRFDIGYE